MSQQVRPQVQNKNPTAESIMEGGARFSAIGVPATIGVIGVSVLWWFYPIVASWLVVIALAAFCMWRISIAMQKEDSTHFTTIDKAAMWGLLFSVIAISLLTFNAMTKKKLPAPTPATAATTSDVENALDEAVSTETETTTKTEKKTETTIVTKKKDVYSPYRNTLLFLTFFLLVVVLCIKIWKWALLSALGIALAVCGVLFLVWWILPPNLFVWTPEQDAELKAAFDKAQLDVIALSNRVDSTDKELDTRLSQLTDRHTKLDDRVTTAEGTLSTQVTNHGLLAGRVTTAETNITDLQNRMKKVETALEALPFKTEADAKKLTDRLNQLETWVNDNKLPIEIMLKQKQAYVAALKPTLPDPALGQYCWHTCYDCQNRCWRGQWVLRK